MLALDAPAPRLPPLLTMPAVAKPPPDDASEAQVKAGALLYNRHCAGCHVLGRGVLPDLRHLSPEKHGLFSQIVRGGVLDSLGMSSFEDVVDEESVRSLHGYLIHEAWREYAPTATTPY